MDLLDEAASGKGLTSAYQQVVSLPTETVVGYEALARWPSHNGFTPNEVFNRAERLGTLDQLDRECIRAAVRGALEGSSTSGMLLLVNCEPATAHLEVFADPALDKAANMFHLMFELTERGLLTNPRVLLRKVAALRALGFSIALDDIGAQADSLALLDIIAPDLLKLDLGLIQRQPDQMQARTIAAVIAHHERTGAPILAEGIETDEHLEKALAYGATLGQGYRFGYPGELTPLSEVTEWPASGLEPGVSTSMSNFEVATRGLTTRVARKRTLLELSNHLERLAFSADSPPIVLTTVQRNSNFRGATLARYTALAEKSPLVVVFGEGVPSDVGPRIRGVSLEPGDPMSLEWTILVLGPDIAAGLIARELGGWDLGPEARDDDRRFEMAITFDRGRVTAAARSLLSRFPENAPTSSGPPR